MLERSITIVCVLTEEKHAGIGGPQAVGGEAGVVAKVFLGDVGEKQQGTRLLVLNPQRVVTLHQSARKDTRQEFPYTKKSRCFLVLHFL